MSDELDSWPVSLDDLEALHETATAQADGLSDGDAIAMLERRIGPLAARRAHNLARRLVWEAHASGMLDRVATALMREGSLTGAKLDRLLDTTTGRTNR